MVDSTFGTTNKILNKEALEAAGFPLTAQFLSGLMGLAYRLSNMYVQYQHVEDFKQIALTIATQLEPAYDTARGASFYTYVAPKITAECYKAYGTAKKHSPMYTKIENYCNDYHEAHGYYPDILQISKGLKEPLWKLNSIYKEDLPKEVQLTEDLSTDLLQEPITEDIEEALSLLSELQRTVVQQHIMQEVPMSALVKQLNMPLVILNAELEKALAKLKDHI